MRPTLRTALGCGLTALAVAWLALVPSLDVAGRRVSLLVRMSSEEPMAAFARVADANFAFVEPQDHYDGVYFYAIALDPFAEGEQHQVLTQPAYRYRDPLYGWLAALVSLGHARLLPVAMLAANVTAFVLAAALVSLIAGTLGQSAWLGLLVALNPGFVIALTVDTAEPIAMAFIAAGVLAWLHDRRWAAAIALTAGAFAREIGALVALGIVLYEVVAWIRAAHDRPARGDLLGRVAPLMLAPLAYAAWWLYLLARLGSWPFFEPSNLAIPPEGTLGTLERAARMTLGSADQMQIGIAMVPLLAVGFVALVLSLLRALRLRTTLDGIAIPVALLVLSLDWWPTLYPKEMIRNLAIAAVLVVLAAVSSTRRPSTAAKLSSTPP